jgi:phosphoglycerol transferase
MTFTYLVSGQWDWWRFGVSDHYGYPNGLNLNLYPSLDILQNDFAHIVALATGSPFLGINLLLMISFPLVAVLAYAAIRLVGLSGPIAVALATSFTFIPFHFGRGIGHMYLATLFGAVAGLILVLIVASGRLQWWWTTTSGGRRAKSLSLVGLLVVVSAWSGLYYAVFTLILLLAAVVWRVARGDRWRQVSLCALPLLAVLGLALLSMLPSLLTRAVEPGTVATALRDPMDSVTYAGNLAVTLFPEPYSLFFPAYNEFVLGLFKNTTQSEPVLMYNFGTSITTIALIVMLVGLVRHFRRIAQGHPAPEAVGLSPAGTPPRASLPLLAYLLAVLLVFFVPWGLNFFVANFVTAQIRGWNRLVPLILLLFILGAAATLAATRWSTRPRVAWPVAGLIVAVAIIEMVLPWRHLYAMVSEGGRVKVEQAYAYAASVNAALPDRCGVLTLPLMLFPNNGPVSPAMDDGDHFIIGMTNPEKDLSYGAVRDTEASAWQAGYSGVPTPEQVRELKFMGFCGVHLDTAGFEDPVAIDQQMQAQLGEPVATSGDGRWLMYSLG